MDTMIQYSVYLYPDDPNNEFRKNIFFDSKTLGLSAGVQRG